MSQRWLLLPNAEIDLWVRQALTKVMSHHTLMGVTSFTSSDSLIKHLFIQTHHREPNIPDHITLPLFIHATLSSSPVFAGSQEKFLSKTPSYATTKKLAYLFKNFYTFSESPQENKKEFAILFSFLKKQFTPISTLFSDILHAIKENTSKPASLHIFGYTHLPKHIVDFLSDLERFFPVYFYCLAPTQEYFGDLLSDRAIDYFSRQYVQASNREQWEHYVSTDRHHLLANLAHRSQITQNFFLDKNIPYLDAFVPYQKEGSLQAVQTSMLMLQPTISNYEKETIKLRIAPNRIREVQNVFQEVSCLIHEGVSTEEIFILSPDPDSYENLLKGTFHPHLPLYFTKHISKYGRDLKEKFVLLSALLHTQGNFYRILQLLAHPQLQTPIDKSALPYLVQTLSRIWSRLTAKYSFPLTQLIKEILQQYPFCEENGQVHHTEVWEELLPLLQKLQTILLQYAQKDSFTYHEHAEILFAFLKDIFIFSAEELAYLIHIQNTFSQQFAETICSVSYFIDFCLDTIEHVYDTNPFYNKPGPFVGSLRNLSFIPKGYTFILGATYKQEPTPLVDLIDLENASEEFVFSSPEDEENYHFLQTLISTQHALYISYPTSSHEPAQPASYLKHLQDFLPIQEERIPIKPYSPSVFVKTQLLPESQAHYYDMARSFLQKKHFLPELVSNQPAPYTPSTEVTVQDLVKVLTNPIDSFLHAHFQLPFSTPQVLVKEDHVFPSSRDIHSLWEKHALRRKTSVSPSFLSQVTEKILQAYDNEFAVWFEQQRADSLFSVFFSSRLFQEESGPKDMFLPPVSLQGETRRLYGEIGCVFPEGVYLCAITPTSPVKCGEKKDSYPSSLTELGYYLEANISLAMLQYTHVLNDTSTIRKLLRLDSWQNLSPNFSNPEEYLRNVFALHDKILSKPTPLLSIEAWKEPEEMMIKQMHDYQNQEDPKKKTFWQFFHREMEDFTPDEETLSLIHTVFHGIPNPSLNTQ